MENFVWFVIVTVTWLMISGLYYFVKGFRDEVRKQLNIRKQQSTSSKGIVRLAEPERMPNIAPAHKSATGAVMPKTPAQVELERRARTDRMIRDA